MNTRGLILIVALALVTALILWPEDEPKRVTRVSPDLDQGGRAKTSASAQPRGIHARDDTARATAVATASDQPRTGLDVTVVDEAGQPRSGVPVLLRLRTPEGPKTIAEATTDDQGFARLEDQNTPELGVWLDPGGTFKPMLSGRWNPDSGYRSLRLILGAPRELTIHVRLDGKPGFPKRLSLLRPILRGEQRDPINGIIRGQFIPQSAHDLVTVSLRAPGCTDANKTVRMQRATSAADTHIDMATVVDLQLRILGKPEFAERVGLVRLREDQPPIPVSGGQDWGFDRGFEESETETSRSLGVPPGRYRVVLGASIKTRPVFEFEIAPGKREHTETVDLRSSQWIDIKTVLPRGYAPPWSVLVKAQEKLGRSVTILPQHRLLLLAGSQVTLTIVAPLLRPHPSRGSVVARSGGTVTLEAIRAPILSFEWNNGSHPKQAEQGTWFSFDGRANALNAFRVTFVARGKGNQDPIVRTAWPDRDGVRYRCGPIPSGRFDLVLRHPTGGAPLLRPNVALGEDDVALGTITPLPGSTLQVELQDLPPTATATVTATASGFPFPLAYARCNASKTSATLSRLPAADILVEIAIGSRRLSRTIECDGLSRKTIEIDCRDP